MDRAPPFDSVPENDTSDEALLRATLRVNTLMLGIVFGAIASAALVALSVLANYGEWIGGLLVALLGVFLPGYGRSVPGALFGALWGFAIGGSLGALVYRLNTLHVLDALDGLVIAERTRGDFPRAVLRLHAPSLGLAIGATGAIGLVITTNLLVLRGTATESVHARLLSEVLPGYAVTPLGSVVGALELFAVLYVFCALFVAIYNGVARRRRGAVPAPAR